MDLIDILQRLETHAPLAALADTLRTQPAQDLRVAPLISAARLPIIAMLARQVRLPLLIVTARLEQAARLLEPKVRLAKVNTEAEPHLAAQFGIRSIPTLALFLGGREIARQAGAMGAQDIVRWASSAQAGC